MEGDQKKNKRKLMDVVEEEEELEEEESEEVKMEKFYELIRISKDIRARMMMINGERSKLEEDQRMMKKKKNGTSIGGGGGAWNPTFQLEDFMEDHGLGVILSCPSSRMINSGTAAGPSKSKKDDDDDHKGGSRGDHTNGLDLNLSL